MVKSVLPIREGRFLFLEKEFYLGKRNKREKEEKQLKKLITEEDIASLVSVTDPNMPLTADGPRTSGQKSMINGTLIHQPLWYMTQNPVPQTRGHSGIIKIQVRGGRLTDGALPLFLTERMVSPSCTS